MEKNYYHLVFMNQKEYFIESEIDNIVGFLNLVESKGEYIPLQREEGDPVQFKSTHLFSVQKARQGIIGAQTKLWRIT